MISDTAGFGNVGPPIGVGNGFAPANTICNICNKSSNKVKNSSMSTAHFGVEIATVVAPDNNIESTFELNNILSEFITTCAPSNVLLG